MSRSQERQSSALRSLHDISDYSQYIDERINKLNKIYQSLELDTKSKKTLKRTLKPEAKSREFPFLQAMRRSKRKLFRQMPEQPTTIDNMYRTEYLPRKNRYSEDENMARTIDKKSLTLSNFRSNLVNNRRISQRNEEIKNNTKNKSKNMLNMYSTIKNDMLETFYVDGKTLNQSNRIYYFDSSKFQLDNEIKLKKGRLWHGRPPVKIIQNYQ